MAKGSMLLLVAAACGSMAAVPTSGPTAQYRTSGKAMDVVVHEDTAYVLTSEGVEAVHVDTMKTGGKVALAEAGAHIGLHPVEAIVYVATAEQVYIVDMENMTVVGSFNHSLVGAPVSVGVTEEVLLLVGAGEVQAYNLTEDRYSPEEAESYAFAGMAAGAGAVDACGDKLWVSTTAGMQLLNVESADNITYNATSEVYFATAVSHMALYETEESKFVYLSFSQNSTVDGVAVYDLSHADGFYMPKAVGHLLADVAAHGVAVADGFVYVAAGAEGLYVMAVGAGSDEGEEYPAQQYKTHGVKLPHNAGAHQVELHAGFAVVATQQHVHLMDIHQYDPFVLSTVAVAAADGAEAVAVAFAVQGELLFIAEGAGGASVYDITDTRAPAFVGNVAFGNMTHAVAVAVGDGYAYVLDRSYGVQVVAYRATAQHPNVSEPEVVGSFAPEGADVQGVALAQEYGLLYLLGGSGHVVEVVNVTEGAEPTAVGSATVYGTARDAVVDGTLLYVAEHDAPMQRDYVSVWDVTAVDRGLARVSAVRIPVAGSGSWAGAVVQAVTFNDSYALALTATGVHVVDVCDPVVPRVVASYEGAVGGATDFAYDAQRDAFYVTSTKPYAGLQVLYRASAPGPYQPLKHEARYSTEGAARDVRVWHGVAAILTDKALELANASHPTYMQRVSTVPLVQGQSMAVSEGRDLVFVTAANGSVTVVDVGNMTHPSVVCTWAAPGVMGGADGAVYAAIGANGTLLLSAGNSVRTFDVTDACHPVLQHGAFAGAAGELAFASPALTASGSGARVYVPSNAGLYALDARNGTLAYAGVATNFPTAVSHLAVADHKGTLFAFATFAATGSITGVGAYALGQGMGMEMQPAVKAHFATDYECFGLDVVGPMLFVSCGYDGLFVIPVDFGFTQPHDSVLPEVPDYRKRSFALPTGARKVAAHMGHAIVATEKEVHVMSVQDVNIGRRPMAVANLTTPASFAALAVHAGRLYTAEAEAGLGIYDIASVSQPVLLSRTALTNATRAIDIAVGRYVYVLDADAAVHIFDTSAAVPVVVGMYDSDRCDMLHLTVSEADNLLYLLTDQQEVEVVNITNVMAPDMVAEAVIFGSAQDTTIDETLMFMAERNQLSVWDRSPLQVGLAKVATVQLPGAARAVAYRNDSVAYVMTNTSLHLVDVCDAVVPQEVASLTSLRSAVDMAYDPVTGYVFVAGSEAGSALQVLFTPPMYMPLTGHAQYSTEGAARDVAVWHGKAYILTDKVLEVADASNPNYMQRVSTVPLVQGHNMAVSTRGYAFVTTGNMSVVVVDLRNASQPVVMCEWAHNQTAAEMVDIEVVLDVMFLTGHSVQGFNVSHPCMPVRSNHTASHVDYEHLTGPSLLPHNNTLFVSGKSGLNVLDVSAFRQGEVKYVGTSSNFPTAVSHMVVSDSGIAYTTFAAQGSVMGVGAYDLRHGLTQPAVLAHFVPEMESFGLDVVEDMLFVAGGLEGVVIVPVAFNTSTTVAPKAPELKHVAHPLAQGAHQVELYMNHTLIATQTMMDIVNVENVLEPKIVDGIATEAAFASFAVHGGKLFTAEGAAGVRIHSLEGMKATLLGGLRFADGADVVDVAVGEYLYVLHASRSVSIVNYSNPADLSVVGNYSTGVFSVKALRVSEEDNLLYVVPKFFDMEVVNITNKAAPVLVDYALVFGATRDAAIDETLMYLAEDDTHLKANYLSVWDRTAVYVGLGKVSSLHLKNAVKAVQHADSVAYVLTNTSLHLVDVCDAVVPEEFASYPLQDAVDFTYDASTGRVFAVSADPSVALQILYTSFPATVAPPTAAPPTASPPTSSPPTVAPATPAPATPAPPTATPPATVMAAQWCTSNRTCQAHGDTAAYCDTAVSECVCGSDFFPVGRAKVCVKDGAAVTASVLFKVVFEVECTLWELSFVLLMREVFGSVTTGVVASQTTACGSLQVNAAVDGIPFESLASADVAGTLAEKYATDGAYAKMQSTLGTPSSASFSIVEACASEGTTSAGRTHDGECRPTECATGYALQGNVCVPLRNASSDNGLEDWQIAIIAVGSVLGMALLVGGLYLLAKRTPPAPRPVNKNEPISDSV